MSSNKMFLSNRSWMSRMLVSMGHYEDVPGKFCYSSIKRQPKNIISNQILAMYSQALVSLRLLTNYSSIVKFFQ